MPQSWRQNWLADRGAEQIRAVTPWLDKGHSTIRKQANVVQGGG